MLPAASLRGPRAVLASRDTRWALVSTSVTALVAGAVALLAVGAMPPGLSTESTLDRALMPYQLFMQLAKGGDATYASLGPSLPVARIAELGQQAPTLSELTHEDKDLATGIETHTITLERGDTLAGALMNAGISAKEAHLLIDELSKAYNPRAIHSGQSFDLTFAAPAADIAAKADDNPAASSKLLSMLFSPAVDHDITVTRTAAGNFAVDSVQKVLQPKTHHMGATITSSLYLSAMRAGIPAEVVVEMIKMFSYEVDFQRDLQQGDKFEVMYTYHYTLDGQPAKKGDIAYAAMKTGGRTIALYRHQLQGQPPDYFDATGRSARSMLMKTPVDGARISSGFGLRRHPVLGYSRMHKGIDFAVPIGTPVMAAGSGTVQVANRSRGYGNFVQINHGNGYSTAYAHLSRFAAGIRSGSKVQQGQIVAYSGNTGMSTGPHLHYEIRKNGGQLNPAGVKFASGRSLAGTELRSFMNQRLHIDMQRASIPMETKLAISNTPNTSDLRHTK